MDRGIDALDWVRGRRPWFQFLSYCTGLATTPGTRLQAAQLSDDRYLAEIEAQLEADTSTEPYRPPLEHFGPVVKAIYDLDDTIRMLDGRAKLRPRPEGPVERIKKRKRNYSLAKIRSLLGGG